MPMKNRDMNEAPDRQQAGDGKDAASSVCPVCGAKLVYEKCKVVCRSERCVYRIVFNCAEF